MINVSIFGDARSNYIEASYNHGATPSIFINSDSHTRYTIYNRDGLGRDYAYVIDNYGTTPSDTNPNYDGTLEDFHWIANYGGPYTGWLPTWIIGVTPLMHADSIHLDQRSFAITYQDGCFQVDQIESYYTHGYYSR